MASLNQSGSSSIGNSSSRVGICLQEVLELSFCVEAAAHPADMGGHALRIQLYKVLRSGPDVPCTREQLMHLIRSRGIHSPLLKRKLDVPRAFVAAVSD